MVRYIFSILFLIGITLNAQTNYYVKNGGSDSNTGLSDGQAWKTLGKADDVTFVPGDTLFMARGSKWKEIFEPKGDGTSDSTMVVVMDYGTGAKPIITGRDTLSGSSKDANWTETGAGSGHWYFSVTGMGFSVDNPINRLWINSTERRRSKTLLLLTATDLFFYDSATDRLYIHSVPNPGTLTNIEAGNVRTRAVNLYGDNYFKFYNIDFQGGMYSVRITGGSDGIMLDSCNVGKYSPGYGVASGDAVGSTDDITIQNCTFDTDMEIKYEIGGFYIPERGINIQYTADNWEISHNYFKNWGYSAFAFIYIAGYDLTNLKFHHNDITSPDTYEGKPIGISSPNGGTQEYYNNYMHNLGVGCQMTGVGWKFYSNIIDTIRGAPLFTTVSRCGMIISNNVNSACYGIQMFNNTIANCSGPGIYLGRNSSATLNTQNQIINNILYNNGADEDDEQIQIRNFSTIHTNTFKNNLLYKTGITDLVNYRDTLMTVTEFNARNSNSYNEVILNNITGDPLFISGTFELSETSPAVNAGIDVWITIDYAGTAVPQGNFFDIGAYEFSAFPVTTSGLGWEDVLSKRNFKSSVNFADGFSVEGIPIIFSGGQAVNIPGLTASAHELNILDGAILSTTEINYVDGVTSGIQAQLDDKADTVDQAFTGTTTISDLRVGNILSPRIASLDSLVIIPAIGTTTLVPFMGVDTGFVYIRKDMRVDISTVAVMLDDTLRSSGKHILYTQWQVDSIITVINTDLSDFYLTLFCSEYDTIYTAMVTKPSPTIALAQNAMVDSLVVHSYWDDMKLWYTFATSTSQTEAKINWVRPGLYTAVNNSATVWEALNGYKGDGMTDYISTGWTPLNDTTTFTGGTVTYGMNSGTLGVYCMDDVSESVGVAVAGGANLLLLTPHNNGNNLAGYVNSGTPFDDASTNSQGLFVITRTAHATEESYRNAVHIADGTAESTALPNSELKFLYDNANYSTNQIAIAFVKNGTADADVTIINTIIKRYMDAIGTGVE